MSPEEVAALLAYATRLDPRLATRSEADADAQLDQWCELLADVPATAPHPDGRDWHAGHVVRHQIASSPYPIKPSDVSVPWHKFRRDVIGRHTDPVPAADPDDEAAWRAELIGTRNAVAAGQATATTYRALTAGGPAPEVEERLAALGSYMPRSVRDELARYRPRAAARVTAIRAGKPDALAVPCPYDQCRARRNEACRMGPSRKERKTPHPSRTDAAAAAETTGATA